MLLALVVLSLGAIAPSSASETPCAVCTVAISVVERLAVVHNASVADTVSHVCELFPKGAVREACAGLVKEFGPAVIKLLTDKDGPDVVCHTLKLCNNTCHLFPPPPEGVPAAAAAAAVRLAATGIAPPELTSVRVAAMAGASAPAPPLPPGLPKICAVPGLRKLCLIIFGWANNHLPLEDDDGDGFSGKTQQFRGTDWRGKDCGPHDAAVHPGAAPDDGDRVTDSNCNGIVGVNPATDASWEDELCAGTPPFGTVVLGDSASAHFHIPPAYLDATKIDNSTYATIEAVVANEFDWPMLSATSAFYDSAAPFEPYISGPVNSSYSIIRSRNRCAHRDYQNIAVNGARSGAMNSTIQQGLSRSITGDRPVVLMYALIGNDVCNGHVDTEAHMTTPTQFKLNVDATLSFLETKLPPGSHVLLMGLAEGTILYEAMHTRTHPLGVLYTAVYDFLNCLAISPCRGWLTSNATMRAATQQRADELSAVLQTLVNSSAASAAGIGTSSNFKLHYVPNPIAEALVRWQAQGGEAWQLIEPVDGFHPNQLANALVTGVVWDQLLAADPTMVPVNPNNAQIAQLFGDQGGY